MISTPVLSKLKPSPAFFQGLWPLRAVTLLAGLLLFWNLSYAPLWNPDEGRYASAALEMSGQLAGGTQDWIIPHLNTVPRLNKPPLNLWMGAFLLRWGGPSETAVRLVSALASLGVMLCLWGAGRRHGAERSGLLGAMVWATAVFPFFMARVFNTDMPLTFGLTLALLGLYGLCTAEYSKVQDMVAAGIGLGLAMLAKGPAGFILPIAITAAYVILTRGGKRIAWIRLIFAALLGLSIAVTWFWMVETRHPSFLHNFFFAENLARFSGGRAFHKPQPLYYFLPVLIVGLLPWTAFVPLLCRKIDRSQLFFWLWAGFIIVGFSLSKVKLVSYVLPAFPALALLIGMALSGWNSYSYSARRWCAVLCIGFMATVAVASSVFLLNDKIVPRAEGGRWLAVIVVIFGVGSLLVWRGGDGKHLPLRVGLLASIINIMLVSLAGRVALYEDASAPLRLLSTHLKPQDRVIMWRTFQPAAMFYYRRPVEIYHTVDNSGLDEEAMRDSPYFRAPESASLEKILSGKSRVLILARRREVRKLPTHSFSWAVNNDYVLFANQPRPDGMEFDFVAPRKR